MSAGSGYGNGDLERLADRILDGLSGRPNVLTIGDREAAKLQLMQNRAMADLP